MREERIASVTVSLAARRGSISRPASVRGCAAGSVPFAFRAADEDVAEELHLDLLEAIAAATLAAAVAGVEGEGTRGEPLRPASGRGEELADVIEDAEIQAGLERGVRESGD